MSRVWTHAQEEFLGETYPRSSITMIAARLHRTKAAVRFHARLMGIRRDYRTWSPARVAYLRENYQKIPARLVARHLRTSLASVYTKACKLGIARHHRDHPRSKPWAPEEDAILESYYGETRPAQIAARLGRTRGSVYHRVDRLGLASRMGTSEYLKRQALPRTARPFTHTTDPGVLGYVAGIIDGEGSILHPPRIAVSVSTTTLGLAVALQNMIGGSVAGPYLYEKRKRFGSRMCWLKPQYHWNFSAQYHVYLLLTAVQPFLVVKRTEAGQAIAYFKKRYRWGTR